MGVRRFQSKTQLVGGTVAALGLAMMSLAGLGSLRPNWEGMPMEDYVPLAPWVLPVLAAGTITLIVGILVLSVGLAREQRKPPAPSRADLRPVIESRELPFTVCTACRIVIDLPYAFACPQCDSMQQCVRVESDAERGFAISALGPPPS